MAAGDRCCGNCVFWTSNPGEKWGRCRIALNAGTFTNHTKIACAYTARHTNSRYHTARACRQRFVRRTTQ